MVDESFVPSTQWASVLYWRLTDFYTSNHFNLFQDKKRHNIFLNYYLQFLPQWALALQSGALLRCNFKDKLHSAHSSLRCNLGWFKIAKIGKVENLNLRTFEFLAAYEHHMGTGDGDPCMAMAMVHWWSLMCHWSPPSIHTYLQP